MGHATSAERSTVELQKEIGGHRFKRRRRRRMRRLRRMRRMRRMRRRRQARRGELVMLCAGQMFLDQKGEHRWLTLRLSPP